MKGSLTIKIVRDNIYGICAVAVCFLLIYVRGIFIKNYSDDLLAIEYINSFLYALVFIVLILQFLRTRTADTAFLLFGFCFCCCSMFFRNCFLPFFTAGPIIKAPDVIALSHIGELIFFTCCGAGALYLKVQRSEKIEDDSVLSYLNLGAFVIAALFSAVLFFKYSSLIGNNARHIMVNRFILSFLFFAQVSSFAACAYAAWDVVREKRSTDFWTALMFLFLFISSIFFYRAINENSMLSNALMYQTTSFIIILIGTIDEYYKTLQKKLSYSKLLEKEIADKERKLVHKAEAFETLREETIESQETSRIKSDLLANMSHELRTPMNSIIGFTSRVIRKTEGTIPERQTKNLRTVERNAHHLLSLINTILDVSKIEAGRMEVFVEEVALSSIIDDVVEMGRSLLGGKEVALINDSPEDILIKTDRTKMRQMLVNLMGNAIKFTEQGEIKIRAERKEFRHDATKGLPVDGVAISVKDTGVGVKEEDLKYIFDDYKQVDGSLTRKTGGTGLGLALVKRFSYLLGGVVSVESEYQRGTIFTIRLPLDSSAYIHEEKGEDQKEVVTSPWTVLCYESDESVSNLYTSLFKEEGFVAKIVPTIDNAFTAAKELHPRLITVDLLSPHKKGIDLIRKFKGNYYTKDILICAAGFFQKERYGYFTPVIDIAQKPVGKEFVSHILNTVTHYSINVNNVLLVDNDEAEINMLHDELLQQGDYRVRMARDVAEVVQVLNVSRPDVIILNIMMPQMEGFKIIGELGTKKNWCTIPVIISVPKMIEKGLAEIYQGEYTLAPKKAELRASDVIKKMSDVAKEGL
ncbi:MAG: response regulator [Candidatus Omnitrophica bacterium]|nr:response regulator [Candidatus Omnitrophota bacterium]